MYGNLEAQRPGGRIGPHPVRVKVFNDTVRVRPQLDVGTKASRLVVITQLAQEIGSIASCHLG